MALPKNVQNTLYMKPEVSKIFDDLEAWHDYCRFNLLDFNPADLYRSPEYKNFQRWNGGERRPRTEYKGKNPRPQFNRNDNFSR
jgi:hypothetical protein